MMLMEDQKVPEANGRVVAIRKSYLLVAALGVVAILVGYILLSGSGETARYIEPYSPVLGNGTINVVEFSDYECPFCQAAEGNNQEVIGALRNTNPSWQPAVPNIVSEYVETGMVNLIFRHFPVHGDMNPAMASYCAQDQGMFWEYHNLLFENYENLTLSDLMEYSSDLGMYTTQFNQCLTSQKHIGQVQQDLDDVQALGFSTTPMFFIGNDEIGYETVVGAQPFSVFKQVIESKL